MMVRPRQTWVFPGILDIFTLAANYAGETLKNHGFTWNSNHNCALQMLLSVMTSGRFVISPSYTLQRRCSSTLQNLKFSTCKSNFEMESSFESFENLNPTVCAQRLKI